LVTGDIGEADRVARILTDLQEGYAGQLSFVLGNHDYYGGSFRSTDEKMAALARTNPDLVWLSQDSPPLAPGVVLVGHEGFYDARLGDERTDLKLRDFTQIEDLFEAQDESHRRFLEVIRARADACAEQLEENLRRATKQGQTQVVLVATHIPPFQEAAWYQGRAADAMWAPFFSSRATGEALLRVAADHEDILFITLCGHTHSEGRIAPRSNLVVYTGGAIYGSPALCGLIDVAENEATVRLLPLGQTSA
jgi:predicted phosphohydrolase